MMSIIRIVFCIFILSKCAFAQVGKSVIIGSMVDRPNALMVLNPPEGNQGFLAPQLTTQKRLSMRPLSPFDDGLLVFDATEKSFYFWKDNAWVRGLGNDATSLLAFDPSTYKLKLGATNEVDLSSLKELPGLLANGGKFLSTDGTSLLWTTAPTLPGPLTSADAGKALVWTGTAWTPQVVSGSTHYTMIDPSEFTNLRRGDKKDKDNIIMFDDNSTYVTTIKKDEGPQIIAPLQLPHGAILEEITLYYMDQDINNIAFNIFRKTPAGVNQTVVNSWSSTGSSGTIQSSIHTPIAGNETIDNDNYSYRIVINLDQSGDVNNSTDAKLRVYAVRVKYLL